MNAPLRPPTPSEYNRELGDWIRRERLARGLAQAELADAVRVSPASLSHWELGRHAPTAFVLDSLKKFFRKTKPKPAAAAVTDSLGRVRRPSEERP